MIEVDNEYENTNLDDGRYLVFSSLISPEGRLLTNYINSIIIKDMNNDDNIIQTIKAHNNLWDSDIYIITGITKLKENK